MSARDSLCRHQVVLYAQANLLQLTAKVGLGALWYMFVPNSIAHNYFFDHGFQPVSTLEAAFFLWDRRGTDISGLLRQWRNLKITHFKTETVSWKEAMENFNERAVQVQSQLNPSNQDEGHLFEVLRSAIEDQTFYTFVESTKQSSSALE